MSASVVLSAPLAQAQIVIPPGRQPPAEVTAPILEDDPSAPRIADIIVEGAQRTSPSSILLLLPFGIGDALTPQALDAAVKVLFATGLFADVRLSRRGDEVLIEVEENPVLNKVVIEGNKAVKDEFLLPELRLAPGQVLSESEVQADIQRLLTLYRRRGRFATRVTPEIIELANNRVNLIYKVAEARPSKIKIIRFNGNETFSKRVLEQAILSKEQKPYRFIGTGQSWDADRVDVDTELLRQFYLDQGFIDVEITSTISELAENAENFAITFDLRENTRWRRGELTIENRIESLDVARLERIVSKAKPREGDWLAVNRLRALSEVLADEISLQGINFFQVNFAVDRQATEGRADVRFFITPTPPVFIERIEIIGNHRTRDNVIRRNLSIVDGDPFNVTRINQSVRRVRALGFFADVSWRDRPGRAGDSRIVTIEVTERSTGGINLGLQYSDFFGVALAFGFGDSNFRGSGNSATLELSTGQEQQRVLLSYFNPAVRDSHIALGYDVNYEDTNFDELTYDLRSRGIGVTAGYAAGANWRHNFRLGTSEQWLYGVSSNASPYTLRRVGTRVTNSLRASFARDTTDNAFAPTKGTRLRFSLTHAGLGGDVGYNQASSSLRVFVPLSRRVTYATALSGGVIRSTGEPLTVTERFVLGGSLLRGFVYNGHGPYDSTHREFLGGESFYALKEQLNVALLSPEIGLSLTLFADVGSVFDINEPPLPAGDGNIIDSRSLRSSLGYGILWVTPIGPISFEFPRAQQYEPYDVRTDFLINIGTQF